MPEQNAITQHSSPPPNTLSADRWQDFHSGTELAHYLIEDDNGRSHVITANKLMRRVLETLVQRPVFCASRCRVGHYVDLLRKEKRVHIETDWYSNDKATGRMRYGVYRLVSKVTRIDGQEVR